MAIVYNIPQGSQREISVSSKTSQNSVTAYIVLAKASHMAKHKGDEDGKYTLSIGGEEVSEFLLN